MSSVQHETFPTGEPIERDDWLVAGVQAVAGMIAHGNQCSLGVERSVLELDNNDGGTAL